ncbi:hypothetical protein QWY99_01185 [Flavobacterium branchiarum]|uniref:Uncharacterized protein n=1 Tax=Flavobacterium branchiarum TaxID=1114870 RepID=A0ABV5FQW9_9FLAO|nr:hypothetical protein [Flavobacterium branchiarum]MDN3671679.1 hypothetical protein [Flavobacterium branchiarum]
MDVVLKNIQDTLSTIPALKYVDEDWGQLDDYSPNPPTQFPSALIDIGNLQFSDIGKDRTATPQNRQMATGTIVISIASLKLTNTSARAPQTQRDQAWSIWGIVKSVHAKLHGVVVGGSAGAMMRTAMRKVKRDDGIQEYEVTYTIGVTNV